MKVRLIDVDNKYREPKRRGKRFPNLALTKVSAYYKAQGDTVGFDIEDPDITYISCVFTRNKEHALKEMYEVKKGIYYGGSGISLTQELPHNIEFIKPDYDLYPFQEYAFGFTSRGCPRRCFSYCIVPEKEGKFRRAQHIKEFHDFRFKFCKLLDNNILADKEWFFENTNWAIENKVRIDITQGMDIRLLTNEIAEHLARIKFVDQQMRFAWDNLAYEDEVMAGISCLKEHGINTRRNVSFYVLAGCNGSGFDDALERVSKLKSEQCGAFVMMYEETPELAALARYCDRRGLYWNFPFCEYDRLPMPVGVRP